MTIIHEIQVDFQRIGIRPKIYVKENDMASRFVHVRFYNDGSPYAIDVPEEGSTIDVTALMCYAKPDGTSGVYDTIGEGEAEHTSYAYDQDNKGVTVEIAPSMCIGFGLVRCEIRFVKGGKILGTFTFDVEVERSVTTGTKADDYFSYRALDELYAEIDEAKENAAEALAAGLHDITAEYITAKASRPTLTVDTFLLEQADGLYRINADNGRNPYIARIVTDEWGQTHMDVVEYSQSDRIKRIYIDSILVATVTMNAQDGAVTINPESLVGDLAWAKAQSKENSEAISQLSESIADNYNALKDVAKGENGFRIYSDYDLDLGKVASNGSVVKDGITCHTAMKLDAYNHAESTNYAVAFDGSIYKVDILGYTNKTDTAAAYESGYATVSPLSLYLQSKEFVNLNIRRVDGGAIGSDELKNIKSNVRLYYLVANNLAKRTYVTEAINTLKETLNPRISPIVHTIEVYGSDNIRHVLENITDSSESNRYVVNIHEGTYDIKSYYSDAEWGVESSSFYGLFVPDWVTLVGIGDKEKVILKAEDTAQRAFVSTLNLRNTSGLKNLTVKAKNLRYTIHDDFAQPGQEHYERMIENCDFYGETLQKTYVYGGGIKEGADYTIRNCRFFTDVTSNFSFLIHNNTGWSRCSNVLIENCRFEPVATSFGVLLSSLGTATKLTYVTLKGNKLKRLRLNENSASVYGSGITFKVSGYGNAITDAVQIMNTDGVDYSSYVDLI